MEREAERGRGGERVRGSQRGGGGGAETERRAGRQTER